MTKPLPNTIKVRITKADMLEAGDYMDCSHCLLATAMRRLGFASVTSVSGMFVSFGLVDYRIMEPKSIVAAYAGKMTVAHATKPFTVTLKKVDA